MKNRLQRIKQGSISIHVSESEPHKKMQLSNKTTAGIADELKDMKIRSSEITKQLGLFVRQNDSDLLTMIWPKHLLAAQDEQELLIPIIESHERELEKRQSRKAADEDKKAYMANIADSKEADRVWKEKAAKTTAENSKPENLKKRLANLERQYPARCDGPAKRAMQSEIARIKNALTK